MTSNFDVIVSGVAFPECLRWHENKLWFSDVLAGKVFCFDPTSARVQEIANISPMAGGLGWSGDGDLLAVDIEARKIRQVNTDSSASEFLDLSNEWKFPANDMHVDDDGTLWVGSYGFNPETDVPTTSALARYKNGRLDFPVGDLIFPNGIARLNERQLVVAETFADRLSILTISPDDSVSVEKRIQLSSGATPDGLCVDHDGNIWVASAYGEAVLIVDPHSEKVERAIEMPGRGVFDCTFGGEKMTTLFIATSDVDESRALIDLPGKIFSIEIQ